MMTEEPITDLDLSRWAALASAASPGPWHWERAGMMDEEYAWTPGTIRLRARLIGRLLHQTEAQLHPTELKMFRPDSDALIDHEARTLVRQLRDASPQGEPDRVRAFVSRWDGKAWLERSALFEVRSWDDLARDIGEWAVMHAAEMEQDAPLWK